MRESLKKDKVDMRGSFNSKWSRYIVSITNKHLWFKVTNMLENLDRFLKRTEPEIESITGEERDTASFMKMMRLFNEVSYFWCSVLATSQPFEF